MKTIKWQILDKKSQKELLRPGQSTQEKNSILCTVAQIISDIRSDGDDALKAYTERLDGVVIKDFKVSSSELALAEDIESSSKVAIQTAYENIKAFHMLQLPKDLTIERNGITASKMYRPIKNVGLYIPGGTAPLISTVLMLAIPATIAGCTRIALVSPPDKTGNISPYILYAANLCGVTDIYKVGGAQAIAALAYGTRSLPRVHKIFGPGNKYVTAAKIQVSLDPQGAALDMPAGPSEVLVIADEHANPAFVASDLLAQAEHDVDARSTLVTTSEAFSKKVLEQIYLQKESLIRQTILKQSIEKSLSIITDSIESCFEISNQYAPEHLILHLENPSQYQPMIENAGSVFMGPYTPESLGDYASGPNHVLPTYGYARAYSGLSVRSFMKAITFQEATQEGLKALAPTVQTLALLEGLDAHAQAVKIRCG